MANPRWWKWSEQWPDWGDAGRPVQIRTKTGDEITGVLQVEDSFFTGEDECPLFVVETGTSSEQFVKAEHWRFLD